MPRKSEHEPGDQRGPRPLTAEPGMLARPAADRRQTVEEWLLSGHPSPRLARAEWRAHGLVLLPLGTLFSAVRIPGRVVQAVAASADPLDVDQILDEVLDGGPVVCDAHGPRYYALVPARVPRTWQAAADEWRAGGVECLGHGTYLGVPPPDAVEFPVRGLSSYWSVPVATAGKLCRPLAVARLVAAGVRESAEGGEVWPGDVPLTPPRPVGSRGRASGGSGPLPGRGR